MSEGWIRIHRQIMDWGWYTDNNVKVLFLHLLLRARHQDGEWKGIKLDAGQLITSVNSLSRETGMSERAIRTALEKLESTGEITKESTTKYSIITVNNWILYQTNNKEDAKSDSPSNKVDTSKKRTKNYHTTTNNNSNNEENEKNEKNEESVSSICTYGYHNNVYLTDEEYTRLSGQVVGVKDYINKLSDHIASTGAKYKSHFATIVKWRRKDKQLLDDNLDDYVLNNIHNVPVFGNEGE